MGSESSLGACWPVWCRAERCPDPCVREDVLEEGLCRRRDRSSGHRSSRPRAIVTPQSERRLLGRLLVWPNAFP